MRTNRRRNILMKLAGLESVVTAVPGVVRRSAALSDKGRRLKRLKFKQLEAVNKLNLPSTPRVGRSQKLRDTGETELARRKRLADAAREAAKGF